MEGCDYERERWVRDPGKRRWTPWLMTGAMIAYALTGMMAVAMMSHDVPVEFVCGIGAPMLGRSVPSGPLIEPDVRPGPAPDFVPHAELQPAVMRAHFAIDDVGGGGR